MSWRNQVSLYLWTQESLSVWWKQSSHGNKNLRVYDGNSWVHPSQKRIEVCFLQCQCLDLVFMKTFREFSDQNLKCNFCSGLTLIRTNWFPMMHHSHHLMHLCKHLKVAMLNFWMILVGLKSLIGTCLQTLQPGQLLKSDKIRQYSLPEFHFRQPKFLPN